MRALLGQLIATRKLSVLLVMAIAVVATSLGSPCGSPIGPFKYSHVTPPQWTPNGNHVVLSRFGAITVVTVDDSGSSWPIHGVSDRSDRSVRFDDNYAPNVSPDGTEIAYMRRYTRDDRARDLNYEIHVASLDGSNIRRLTENDSHEVSPVWSPDGKRIAYWSSSPEGPAWALITMTREGTARGYLATVEYQPPPVRWSPDGRQLAFFQYHHKYATPTSEGFSEYAIYVVGADGANLTRLTPTSSSPVWSHDGSRIFFVHAHENADSDDVSTALYSIRPDGTDLRTVASMEGLGSRDWPGYKAPLWGNLGWSPDGSEIWYFTESNIIRIKADGTAVSRMTARYNAGDTWASLSPDGTTVAIGVMTPEGLGEQEDIHLFLMDPDGSNQRVLLRDTAEGMTGGEGIVPAQLIDWESVDRE